MEVKKTERLLFKMPRKSKVKRGQTEEQKYLPPDQQQFLDPSGRISRNRSGKIPADSFGGFNLLKLNH